MEDLNSVVSSLDFIERTLIRSGGIAEENMARNISRAKDVLRQLERERDAAVADLAKNRKCETCKHYEPDTFCVGCTGRGSKWKWRGVQDET